MTAANHDFEVEQGATWRRTLEYRTPAGTPFVLTGWTARMQVRSRGAASTALPLLDLTTANGAIVVDGPAGTATVTITATQTSSLPPGRAVYDLELVSPTGEVTRLIEGSLLVDQNVTR